MICPHCNYKSTNHETLDGETNPEEGDASVCIGCGEVAQFQNGKLIKIQLSRLPTETRLEVAKIQEAWLQTRHMKPSQKTERGKDD